MDTNRTIKTRKITKHLSCRLNNDEIRTRGIDLANANTEYADTKEEAKEAASGFRESLKSINTRIHKLKDAVRNGVEVRPVECEVVIDTFLGNVTITRLDTNAVIEHRPLDGAELKQPGLFDEEDR